MHFFTTQYLMWAIALGAISAVSLPLGSLVGLQTRLRPLVISVLAAFGAGALIAALSIELVAPHVLALGSNQPASAGHGEARSNFFALLAGLLAGGVLYFLLDQIVNAHGGFLRRTSATLGYLAHKRARQIEMLEKLSRFPLLKELPTDHIHTLVTLIHPVDYQAGDVLAVEPGLYAPELKAGLRIEHNYQVTRDGVDLLTDFSVEL